MLHTPLASFTRKNIWCRPSANEVTETDTTKSVTASPGVMGILLPAPMPRSLSIKYSALVMFAAAGGGVPVIVGIVSL